MGISSVAARNTEVPPQEMLSALGSRGKSRRWRPLTARRQRGRATRKHLPKNEKKKEGEKRKKRKTYLKKKKKAPSCSSKAAQAEQGGDAHQPLSLDCAPADLSPPDRTLRAEHMSHFPESLSASQRAASVETLRQVSPLLVCKKPLYFTRARVSDNSSLDFYSGCDGVLALKPRF